MYLVRDRWTINLQLQLIPFLLIYLQDVLFILDIRIAYCLSLYFVLLPPRAIATLLAFSIVGEGGSEP